MCLKLIVLFGHVNSPGELLSLGFVVDLLNRHAPFLAPGDGVSKEDETESQLSTEYVELFCEM